MERVTATLDKETLAQVRLVADREHLARLELAGVLDELDTKHGPVPPRVRAEIASDARRMFRAR
jgi:hypothetical protein